MIIIMICIAKPLLVEVVQALFQALLQLRHHHGIEGATQIRKLPEAIALGVEP